MKEETLPKERELSFEIVKAMETGVNRYLNKSIIYSPFRLFYNLFKKANLNLIEQARNMVREDVRRQLDSIENFNDKTFIEGSTIKPKGMKLLQICYNIGIRLLKEKLTVMTAFKVMRNHELRDEIYNYILNEVKEAAQYVMVKEIGGDK